MVAIGAKVLTVGKVGSKSEGRKSIKNTNNINGTNRSRSTDSISSTKRSRSTRRKKVVGQVEQNIRRGSRSGIVSRVSIVSLGLKTSNIPIKPKVQKVQ